MPCFADARHFFCLVTQTVTGTFYPTTAASGTAGRAQAGKNNLEFPAERDQREKATQLARINDRPLKHLTFLEIITICF
jgi:hypothetical protein